MVDDSSLQSTCLRGVAGDRTKLIYLTSMILQGAYINEEWLASEIHGVRLPIPAGGGHTGLPYMKFGATCLKLKDLLVVLNHQMRWPYAELAGEVASHTGSIKMRPFLDALVGMLDVYGRPKG